MTEHIVLAHEDSVAWSKDLEHAVSGRECLFSRSTSTACSVFYYTYKFLSVI